MAQTIKAVRIGVIADTHGLFDPDIRRHFRGVDHILHAGDIGDRSVIEKLEQIAPVTAVLGNVDDDEQSGFLSEAIIKLAGHCIAIRHILYEGGTLTKSGRAFLDCERPDIFIFGHTHQPKAEWFGKTLLFNPGSAGPKRFKLPRCLGILVLARQGITPKHILLDDRRAKVTPRGAMKSYLGCVSGGPVDLSVKTGQKLRTLLRRRPYRP
jgi:putative phosphoesterase